MIENADIWLNRVFVPDENRLEKAQDFQSGTNRILESSRVGVAWGIAGGAAGSELTRLPSDTHLTVNNLESLSLNFN